MTCWSSLVRWCLSCSVSIGPKSLKSFVVSFGEGGRKCVKSWSGMGWKSHCHSPVDTACIAIWTSVDFYRLAFSILAVEHMLVLHSA